MSSFINTSNTHAETSYFVAANDAEKKAAKDAKDAEKKAAKDAKKKVKNDLAHNFNNDFKGPKILIDIVNYLKDVNITISKNVEGEGRGGSLNDQGTIKKLLFNHPKFKYFVIDEKARRFGDITVLDYDRITRHPVNIKTSIGGKDNCFSRAGTVYAFTDIHDTEIPKSMTFKKMDELLKQHGKNIQGKDYWMLCVDKNDSSNILIRGTKQLNCWTVNPHQSNILQVDWRTEKSLPPVERTYEEAYEIIIGGLKKSIKNYLEGVPKDWLL